MVVTIPTYRPVTHSIIGTTSTAMISELIDVPAAGIADTDCWDSSGVWLLMRLVVEHLLLRWSAITTTTTDAAATSIVVSTVIHFV